MYSYFKNIYKNIDNHQSKCNSVKKIDNLYQFYILVILKKLIKLI